MLKAMTFKVKNVPPHCCGEESISDLSTVALLAHHGINKTLQHLHIQCMYSDPFGYKFKWDDKPDIKMQIIVLILHPKQQHVHCRYNKVRKIICILPQDGSIEPKHVTIKRTSSNKG
jgi:hypothetical protein